MLKQLAILEKVVEGLRQDPTIHSIVLTGSVAYGAAREDSDLDLLIICDKDEFVSEIMDGILVEKHFHQKQTLERRLSVAAMEVYRYLFSNALYDDGIFAGLFDKAEELYLNYRTPIMELERIRYWLSSTKNKLSSAIKGNDELRVSYLVSTNTWKVLEGLYAINHRPVPPSSLAFHLHNTLKGPCEHWFEELLTGDTCSRAQTMIKAIDMIME